MSLETWKEKSKEVYDEIIESEPDSQHFMFLNSLIIILNYKPLNMKSSKNSEGNPCCSTDFDYKQGDS